MYSIKMILLKEKIVKGYTAPCAYFKKGKFQYTAPFWDESSLLIALQDYCKETTYSNIFTYNDYKKIRSTKIKSLTGL